MRRLALALGLAGVLGCSVAAWVVIDLEAPKSFLFIYVVGVSSGLLGALVSSREPRNAIGWLMCGAGLACSLVHLPVGYGYHALITEHGAWPLGGLAVWLGAWSYAAVLVFPPIISVRFPRGLMAPAWRVVDLLAIVGAAGFALGIALAPSGALVTFLPIPGTKVSILAPYVSNPIAVPLTLAARIQGAGLVALLASYVLTAAALITRLRRATGDESLQLKWLAYSGALVAAAAAYGTVAWNFLGQPLYLAFVPLEVCALSLPIGVGIAILRYRLYDIDLIINRTLVYGGLTAILGAAYAALVTFLNRLFISVSGQKSDSAYVITAFAVAVAFGPVKDWLQRQVDRRVRRGNAAQLLDQFRSGVDSVVSVLDVTRIARRLVDEAVVAFDARGGAVYLDVNAGASPLYSRGDLNGYSCIEVLLRHDGHDFGRLLIAERRGDMAYSANDRQALERSAASVAEAIALAAVAR